MVWPEYMDKRSQDLKATFHDAGQFYWMKTNRFQEQRQLFAKNSGAIIIPETIAQDIDNETDWQLAELKYRFSFLNKQ